MHLHHGGMWIDVKISNMAVGSDIMESQDISEPKSQLPAGKMSGQDNNAVPKCLIFDPPNDTQMTSSILSLTSSLTSPVDSGVQLLDSESDITSVMSMSGTACDLDTSCSYDVPNTIVSNTPVKESDNNYPACLIIENCKENSLAKELLAPSTPNVMTKSDIANQNTTITCDYGVYSSSAPNVDIGFKKPTESASSDVQCDSEDSKIDIELKTDIDNKPDIDIVPGKENTELQTEQISSEPVITLESDNVMHVSVSEEANEHSKLEQPIAQPTDTEVKPLPPPDEQIVFRRQRKKKSSKSDTPKKRVSFHEDILNSTKIDDIHINHGFITHQPDISMSFFNFDSVRKRDVVKGRYSWAAEGDTPYYHRNASEREVKSEIYMNSRYSSTSSSSTGSVDSSSSNSLCDNEQSSDGISHTPSQKLPRSSCLKKRSTTKHIDTHIVQEDIGSSLKSRKSESNLLDSNIFGSLKNILSFSTSVPLAERGVPEGQEDVGVYSCSQPTAKSKRNSFASSSDSIVSKSLDRSDKIPEIPKKVGNLNIELSKNSMKLGPSDGFYPNYPNVDMPANVVLCDSNVYEHKGISYSYEYDKFQKSLENAKVQKPKSSTVYQMLLQDLNFFKKKEKEKSENDLKALAESQPAVTSTPTKESKNNSKKSTRSSIADWSSDTETISDFSETISSKHLSSPKHKVNKANHYAVQSFKSDNSDTKSEAESSKFHNLKPATSKSSLINRFLRNVTMKKLLDAKLQKRQKTRTNKCMGLYMRGVKPDAALCNTLDKELEEEINKGQKMIIAIDENLGSSIMIKLKKEVFRNPQEKLVNSFYNQFVLPYPELNTIMVGPNAHTIHFSNADREMQFIISTGSSDITGDLIGQLEMAIRKENNAALPAVRHLSMREMAQLKSAVLKQTTVDKDEEYFHYSVVNVQDVSAEPASTPLGPIKSGPLMFKTANDIRWETGYFILKGGVLYILSSPSNRLPLRALPLGGGACLGAHRTPYCLRPHTFELLLGSVILQLAAPDEYVASEWLQVLVQAASGLYNSHEANHTQSCTLLLTNQHILTMREKFPCGNPISEYTAQALSCAAISDLTAFRIPLAEQSWCILEFACREVHETSGDLVLYFATNAELERFISTLEMLWAYNNIRDDSFPLCTLPEDESISKKCADAYRMLQGAWSSINLVLQ
ncbi:pruning defect 1 [Carabus blaptoides fortunei]